MLVIKPFHLDQHKGYFASDDDLGHFVKDLQDHMAEHGHILLFYKGKPLMSMLSNAEVVQALMRLAESGRVNNDGGV